jgi:hypothetical protein
MMEEKYTCFVIMPFSATSPAHSEDYWTKHFEGFIKPVIEENPNARARRSEALRGDILRQIITDLVVSPIVVADLTDANPNVYWELGVRQSFHHGTITIAQRGTRLPFDLGAKGTLFYDPGDHVQMEEFRRRFKAAIDDCVSHPERPDSHVLETLGGRGTLFQILRRDEALRRVTAVAAEIARNRTVLRNAKELAESNQKEPEKRRFPTVRFRCAAVELLITSRYVDSEETFYELAEEYLDEILSWNGQLEVWEMSPGATEKWVLKRVEVFEKQQAAFQSEVQKLKDSLKKSPQP